MIIDFVIICFKFIGFLFLTNLVITTIYTIIEVLIKSKKISLYESSLYSGFLLLLYIITLFANVFVYTYLIEKITIFYNVEILSRVQLLFVFIPILLGMSLMNTISKVSDRNFEPDLSKGLVSNHNSGYIKFGLTILILLQIVMLIAPSLTKYLISFYVFIF